MTTDAIRDGLGVAIEAHDDLVLVVLDGSLDVYTIPAFRREVEGHGFTRGPVVVDLAGVPLIDSAGLGALLRLLRQAQRVCPGRLGVICPHLHMLKLFEIAGLRRVFSIGPDLSAVRAALAAQDAAR